MRYSKERYMLNIWIVFRRIRYNMMDIVISFPPSQAKAAEEVGDNHSNDGVVGKIVRDAHVSRIMRSKNQLVPETTEKHSASTIPTPVETQKAQGKEQEVSAHLRKV